MVFMHDCNGYNLLTIIIVNTWEYLYHHYTIIIKSCFDVLCLLAHCINPQSNFSYARVIACMFELLTQHLLVVIFTLFPVSTIKVQYKYMREACQQFSHV